MKLTLSFSPCPNDCFTFEAIVNQRIDLEGLEFTIRLADVEALNRAVFVGSIDVTKLSYYAYSHCTSDYVMLNAGGALARDCGPLLISKREISLREIAAGQLNIAIPGRYTTANLLLSLDFPQAQHKTEMLYSDIEVALLEDKCDAGLIIHENRFTYETKGLKKIIDLGELWEKEIDLPLPLGGIVIKRAIPDEIKARVNRVLRCSVEYALSNRAASHDFVGANAQEMSEEAIQRHIDLYVNRYSVDLGEHGRRAVKMLFSRGKAAGIVPETNEDLFLRS
jgi:1,4-dihydroxy-6-naphthoate synthase